MTPFGLKMRELRRQHNRTQQQQATFLGVSKAYISALETGGRGQPSAIFVDQICVWLGLIWDDAENLKRLASLSHPKPSIDVRGKTAQAVYLSKVEGVVMRRNFVNFRLPTLIIEKIVPNV
jgi:transcriptional regulator with XRE-family HTH domain